MPAAIVNRLVDWWILKRQTKVRHDGSAASFVCLKEGRVLG